MSFELCLFTTDSGLARAARAAGIEHLVVDWEARGKETRQQGAGLEQNQDSPDDIARLKRDAPGSVYCRINRFGPQTGSEIEAAVQAGADLILLPMVRELAEVQEFLAQLDGRAGAGILVETAEAVELAAELGQLPLEALYVGLNDLSLSRGTGLFQSVRDGTVESVRRHCRCRFGFGGLTVVDRGEPVPSRLLALEMARLSCDFTFLRRSFKKDIQQRDLSLEVARMREFMRLARTRSPAQQSLDRAELTRILDERPVLLR